MVRSLNSDDCHVKGTSSFKLVKDKIFQTLQKKVIDVLVPHVFHSKKFKSKLDPFTRLKNFTLGDLGVYNCIIEGASKMTAHDVCVTPTQDEKFEFHCTLKMDRLDIDCKIGYVYFECMNRYYKKSNNYFYTICVKINLF